MGDAQMNFVNILVRVLEYGCQPWNLTDGAPAAWLHRRHRRSAQVAKEPSAAKDQGTDQLYCKEWTPFKRRLHLFSLSRCSRSGPCHFTRWPFSLTPQGPFYLVYRNPMDHETTPRNEGWWKGLKDFLIMHSVSFLFEKTFFCVEADRSDCEFPGFEIKPFLPGAHISQRPRLRIASHVPYFPWRKIGLARYLWYLFDLSTMLPVIPELLRIAGNLIDQAFERADRIK